jgi:hypothetical protein
MPETEAPRELAIEKSKHPFYDKLKKGEYLPEFKGQEMVYLFAMAMAYGVYHKKRKPLKGFQRSVSRSFMEKEFGWLIKAVAISVSEEGVDVIPDQANIYKIAEEYANGGIELIERQLKSFKPGEFENEMEMELNLFMEECLSKKSDDEKKDIITHVNSEIEIRVNIFEKGLRRFIDQKLRERNEKYWDDINVDFKKSVDDRIQDHLNKNPSFKREEINPLDFFFLFDYFRMMKENWDIFKPVFRSRTELEKHIQNINELRNCLKHLREPTETAEKMGEASLIWFEKILKED